MKERIIQVLIKVILNMVTPENVRKGFDDVLDMLENYVEKTDREYDDNIILPLTELIRKAFDIPDNDNQS